MSEDGTAEVGGIGFLATKDHREKFNVSLATPEAKLHAPVQFVAISGSVFSVTLWFKYICGTLSPAFSASQPIP